MEGMDGGWMDERENESFFSSGRGQTRLTRKVVLPSGTPSGTRVPDPMSRVFSCGLTLAFQHAIPNYVHQDRFFR